MRTEELAQEIHSEQKDEDTDLFDQLVANREAREKYTNRQGVLEAEKKDFYSEFRKFLVANSHLPAKERGHFVSSPSEIILSRKIIRKEKRRKGNKIFYYLFDSCDSIMERNPDPTT